MHQLLLYEIKTYFLVILIFLLILPNQQYLQTQYLHKLFYLFKIILIILPLFHLLLPLLQYLDLLYRKENFVHQLSRIWSKH